MFKIKSLLSIPKIFLEMLFSKRKISEDPEYTIIVDTKNLQKKVK